MFVPAYSAMGKDSLNVPFKDRIAIHTNSVGWLLMTPNLGVEYSFIQNDLKKVSALLHGRYNPNSLKSYNPNLVYNIGGARAEVRWYYRTRYVSKGEMDLDSLETAKHGAFRAFWNKLTTRPYSLWAKQNPNRHRAYYVGPYAAFDKYTIKLSKTGYQGYAFGLGATLGYSIPLYHYRNGSAIDLELGFSAGLSMSMNDMFTYNDEVDCYEYAGSNSLHVVPFPVIQDARVAFVYRINSIREQIQGIDQAKIDGYAAVYELRKSYDEKIASFIFPYRTEQVVENGDTVMKRLPNEAYMAADSIKAWNKAIEEKNEKIRAVNKLALLSHKVDSAMLLEELRPYYEYITIPEKMFSQYNRTIPNKNIASIKELDDDYLNELLEKYAVVDRDVVKKETNLGQVEDPLLFSYSSLRSKLLEKNDSVSEIRLIDLMVQAVSNVNGNVKSFNDKYNVSYSGKDIEFDAMPVNMQVITGVPGKGYGLDFVFGIDTFALAKSQNYSFKALNDEIEAQNVYKQVALDEILGFVSPEKAADEHVMKKGKKAKKEKESKVKKTREENKAKDGKKNKASKNDVVEDKASVVTEAVEATATDESVEVKGKKKEKKAKEPKAKKVKEDKKTKEGKKNKASKNDAVENKESVAAEESVIEQQQEAAATAVSLEQGVETSGDEQVAAGNNKE